jgi:hypothetical protein
MRLKAAAKFAFHVASPPTPAYAAFMEAKSVLGPVVEPATEPCGGNLGPVWERSCMLG